MIQRNSYFFIFMLAVILAGLSIHAKADENSDAEFVQRAKELRDEGMVRGAIVELKNALQKNPDNTEARWILGQIYLEIGDGADAEVQLLRAIKLGIDRERAIIPVGEALLLQGKFQDIIDGSFRET